MTIITKFLALAIIPLIFRHLDVQEMNELNWLELEQKSHGLQTCQVIFLKLKLTKKEFKEISTTKWYLKYWIAVQRF